MQIYNQIRTSSIFNSINSCVKDSFLQELTERQKKIGMVVAAIFCLITGFFLLKSCMGESKPAESKPQAGKTNGQASGQKGQTNGQASGKASGQTNQPSQTQSSGNNSAISPSAKFIQEEIELNKKTGIVIVNAEDYTDQQKAIDFVKSKYLSEQYQVLKDPSLVNPSDPSMPHPGKFYRTFLAIKEDSGEIIGYLSGEKHFEGYFKVHDGSLPSNSNSDQALLMQVKVRLFLKAMDKTKEFGKNTLIMKSAHYKAFGFDEELKKYNVQKSEFGTETSMHLENYIYKKALRVMLNS